jgi:hypothetical protein
VESKEKLETYEDAMRRIRDATGATDVGEVVQRFLTQGETQEHLRALQRENTEKLSNLREVSERSGSSFCCALRAWPLDVALPTSSRSFTYFPPAHTHRNPSPLVCRTTHGF